MMACVDFVESVGGIDCPSYCPPAPFGWLSPRISFSKDFVETEIEQGNSSSQHQENQQQQQPQQPPPPPSMEDKSNNNNNENNDFEFCLSLPDDPLLMLPADELFYQGKLVPLQCPSRSGPLTYHSSSARVSWDDGGAIITSSSGNSSSRAATRPTTIQEICSNVDPLSVSPKAPKCSSRWRELLGLKKPQTPKQQEHHHDILSLQSPQPHKSSLPSKTHLTPKSLKQLFRGPDSKVPFFSSSSLSSSMDLSSQPLLTHQPPRDSDADSGSARISVSSSCAADLEDMPRYSLDSEKGNPNPIRAPLKVNVRKPRYPDAVATDSRGCRVGRTPYRNIDAKLPPRGSSVDSPRMNSSGKIVYQSLERSCSSPSSFSANMRSKDHHYRNCRQKENRRGMERSYSANVRVTPVLNVPVCSLRPSKAGGGGGIASSKGTMFGLTQLFSPQKKETNKPSRYLSQTTLSHTSSSNPHRKEG